MGKHSNLEERPPMWRSRSRIYSKCRRTFDVSQLISNMFSLKMGYHPYMLPMLLPGENSQLSQTVANQQWRCLTERLEVSQLAFSKPFRWRHLAGFRRNTVLFTAFNSSICRCKYKCSWMPQNNIKHSIFCNLLLKCGQYRQRTFKEKGGN